MSYACTILVAKPQSRKLFGICVSVCSGKMGCEIVKFSECLRMGCICGLLWAQRRTFQVASTELVATLKTETVQWSHTKHTPWCVLCGLLTLPWALHPMWTEAESGHAACSWSQYLNKVWPTRCHLLYYLLLNMFQTLIRPSSGACDYLLYCVGWLEACWCYVAGLSVGDVVSECRLNHYSSGSAYTRIPHHQ